ncbi:MAG TPA: sigma-70 family RNA polymerase sigma factor [Opitutales bacterium]|nr:sigma-70 family RNA polymerase sigma factor [Opitutales bacterium]
MQDRDLLREYLLNRSEAAFAELVSRHINLVHSCAWRVVGDADLAKDVCQKVFIQLAQKAGTVRDGDALAGWLYRVTAHTATSVVRVESRRRKREIEAMNLAEPPASAADTWSAIAPFLEEAMQRLSADEQDALVLRFFEDKSLREVGLALGLSDDAAQKRVSRALEKMRAHFARRGVTASVLALGGVLAAHTTPSAPPGLAAGMVGGALASVPGGVGATGLGVKAALAKQVVVAGGLLAVAGAALLGWYLLNHRGAPAAAVIPMANDDPPRAVAANATAANPPGVMTLTVPLIADAAGGTWQFTLSSMSPLDGEMAVVQGGGTVRPVLDPGDAEAKPSAYVVDYKISWQVFDSRPAPGVPRWATPSLDNFDLDSSATLAQDKPAPVMRASGKTVTLTTDGQKIVLTVTLTGNRPAL